jgi:hypothetical protein
LTCRLDLLDILGFLDFLMSFLVFLNVLVRVLYQVLELTEQKNRTFGLRN